MTVERNGSNALSSVRLRGTTSLTGGNDPLIIVDGVMGDLSLLESVYPTDIESFKIYKDAETAQFGSRGAAGVIEITTRGGKAGKTKVDYNAILGFSSAYKTLDMLSADEYRAECQKTGSYYLDGGASSDFQKAITRKGLFTQHNVSLSGGRKDGNYRVSLSYTKDETVIKNMGMSSFMANMNATQSMFDDFLKIEIGMIGSTQKEKSIADEQYLFYSAAAFNPTLSTEKINGVYAKYPSASQIGNPMAVTDVDNHTENQHIAAHAKLKFNILPSLKASLFGSYTSDNDELMQFYPTTVLSKGRAIRSTDKKKTYTGNLSVEYSNTFSEKHALELMALGELQKESYRGFKTTVTDFTTNELGYDDISAGAQRPWDGTNSYYTSASMVSFLGKAAYTYDDRYSIEVIARTDASSKFGRDNRWAFFPSVSATWQMHNEKFIKDIKWIDKLELNAGYGLSGNQSSIDAYTTLSLIYPNGVVPAGSGTVVTFDQLANNNPGLKWETTRTVNAGVEAEMLEGRLQAGINFYHSTTSDMLYPYDVSVPPYTYPELVGNLGKMGKQGIEISLGGTPLKTKDAELTINANMSFQNNKLLSLDQYISDDASETATEISTLQGAGQYGGDNDVVYQMVGQPIGIFILKHADGLTADDNGRYYYNVSDEESIVGQATPKMLLGTNISFRYKNCDISVQANGAFGHKIYNGTSLSYMNMGSLPFYNVLKEAREKQIYDLAVSDYWLENGNYLNIAYITVGWNVPLKKNKIIESLRLSATINNVATITSYSGLTPMINSSEIDSTLGLDDKNIYPPFRTYTFNMSISF